MKRLFARFSDLFLPESWLRWRRILKSLAEGAEQRPMNAFIQWMRVLIVASCAAWAAGVQVFAPDAPVSVPGMWLVLAAAVGAVLAVARLERVLAGSGLLGWLYVGGFLGDTLLACLAVLVTGGVRSFYYSVVYFCAIEAVELFGARAAMLAAAGASAAYVAFALWGSGSVGAFDLVNVFAIAVPFCFLFVVKFAGAIESERAAWRLRMRSSLLYELSRRAADLPGPEEACAEARRAAAEYLRPEEAEVLLDAEEAARLVESCGAGGIGDVSVVERGGRWTAVAPVRSGGELLGAIVVRTGSRLTGEQIEYLATLANNLGLMLKNRRMVEELKAMALTDPLTGLANRRRLMERLAEEAERARRYGTPLSLLLVDIDRFKQFNDAYGHRFGDLALKEAAQAVKGAVRSCDLAARFGGEELAVLMPETDLAGACAAAERICAEVRRLELSDPETGARARVTVSVGAAEFAGDAERLVREADAALYAAKRAGRDRWAAYSPDLEGVEAC